MNEAYLATARKRVSLARHARLMDYHIHQGNQASTWLAIEIAGGSVAVHARPTRALIIVDRRRAPRPESVFSPAAIFGCAPRQRSGFDPLLNHSALHLGRRAAGLGAGTTTADLVPTPAWPPSSRPTRCATSVRSASCVAS